MIHVALQRIGSAGLQHCTGLMCSWTFHFIQLHCYGNGEYHSEAACRLWRPQSELKAVNEAWDLVSHISWARSPLPRLLQQRPRAPAEPAGSPPDAGAPLGPPGPRKQGGGRASGARSGVLKHRAGHAGTGSSFPSPRSACVSALGGMCWVTAGSPGLPAWGCRGCRLAPVPSCALAITPSRCCARILW